MSRYDGVMNERLQTRPLTTQEATVAGLRCLVLSAGDLSVSVSVDVGPRVIAFNGRDGSSPFAVLPDLSIDCPGVGPFHLRGGHRLWHAPEIAASTYLPDDVPVTVTVAADSATFEVLEGPTALRKSMVVSFGDGDVRIAHTIGNEGAVTASLAPWAITMLAVGGEAWMPQSQAPIDPQGLQANRSIVLWPYSRLDDRRLAIADGLLRLRAVADAPNAVKVGTQADPGWLAYLLGSQLFVKRAQHQWGADYADLGASAQCYSGGRFIELETLGPLVSLAPGAATTHHETWSLHAVDPAAEPAATISQLSLG
jgi:hypothetical protein